MLIVRKAKIEDIPSIHQFVKDLAIYEKEPSAVTATISDYEQDFKSGIFEGHIILMDNKPIGMAVHYTTYSTWKGRMHYLEDFYIHPDHRRSGAGQMLFDAIVQHAQSLGARLLKWQVLDWNKMAINFYRKNDAIIETNWWTGKIIF